MEKLLRHLTCFAAVGVFVGLALPVAGAAEKKDTRPVLDPPPPALPQKVTVARGQRIEIPLRIYGRQSEPLRYLIKSPPAHGKLSEPRVVNREISVVTYEPPPDLGVTADRFTFSVQNHAGVSAPAEITIAIADLPAQFAVAHSLDFEELLAGGTAVKEIEVANRGGGLIEGEIEVDPPFRVEGRRRYRLEAGDYTYFKIVFAPSDGGLFRREIRYSSHREFATTLTGSALTPISAEPAKIELHPGADSAVRTGAFEIVNRTGEALTFKLHSGARVQLPESVNVAAHGRAAIAVSTRPEDVSELTDEVRVESPGFALRIPLKAPKVGPILRLTQRNLALGRIDASRGARATVELENAGGSTAKVTAEIAPPFLVTEPSFELRMGEKKRLALILQPGEPQRYRTWLKFAAGTANAELEIEAEMVGEMGAGRSADTSDSASGKRPAPTLDPTDLPPWMPDLDLARSIRVSAITATSANLEWPAELNGAALYRFERLMLTRDSSKELRNAWVEIPKTKYFRQGPLWVASLTGLGAQQSQTVRVVPLDAEGHPGTALFQLDFFTAAPRSLPKPRLLPSLFFILAVAGGALLWKRIRRQFSEPISGF